MESIAQVLDEMKDHYRRVCGAEPPDTLGAGTPFPPGVDPVALVMAEVQAVRSLGAGAAAAAGTSAAAGMAAVPHFMMGWTPPADIWIDGKELVIALEIAGCDPKDVRVTVSPGCIEVAGCRKDAAGASCAWLGRERPIGTLARTLPVPADAGVAGARARLAAGVLEIRMSLGATTTGGALRREVPVEG
jgi:HSP20 family molecular chaperone IbpA